MQKSWSILLTLASLLIPTSAMAWQEPEAAPGPDGAATVDSIRFATGLGAGLLLALPGWIWAAVLWRRQR